MKEVFEFLYAYESHFKFIFNLVIFIVRALICLQWKFEVAIFFDSFLFF